MGKNISETKFDQRRLRSCGGMGTTQNLVMTASLLPTLAATRAVAALMLVSSQAGAKSKPAAWVQRRCRQKANSTDAR